MTSRVALASSMNVPAVRPCPWWGRAFLDKLRQLGIRRLNESGDYYGPSLALGTADVSLWEMTNAYRTLANGGEWRELHVSPETSLSQIRQKVFSQEAAFLIADILSDREARSKTFGLENPLATRFWTAVKTGTSKDMRDNWCIGYSKKYTVGVWVGNFWGTHVERERHHGGGSRLGGDDEFPRSERDDRQDNPPLNLVKRKVQSSQSADSSGQEWFIRGTEPGLRDRKAGQFNDRIVYPPSGTVMALDPDIPPELQRVFFISQSNEKGLQWALNDHVLEGNGKTFSWSLSVGKFMLALLNQEGKVIDTVHFEVRGPTENNLEAS